MRVGSNVKSDNFTAYDTPITHTHTALSSDENQYLVWPPHASMHMYRVSTGDSFRKSGIDFPGQDPDFDKQHADMHRGMRWPHKVLILVAGQSVCVIGVSKL